MHINDHLRKILVIKYLYDYEGINGLLKLQKFFFLLHEFGVVWFGYVFIMGLYGPFSKLLENDLNDLEKRGYLIKNNGGRIRIKINEDKVNKDFFKGYEDFLKEAQTNNLLEYKIVELLKDGLRTTSYIELAASIIQIIKKLNIHLQARVYEILEEWKPQRFTYDEFEEVWEILLSYKIISKTGDYTYLSYYI